MNSHLRTGMRTGLLGFVTGAIVMTAPAMADDDESPTKVSRVGSGNKVEVTVQCNEINLDSDDHHNCPKQTSTPSKTPMPTPSKTGDATYPTTPAASPSSLPVTGSSLKQAITTAAVLILGGLSAMVLTRRRTAKSETA